MEGINGSTQDVSSKDLNNNVDSPSSVSVEKLKFYEVIVRQLLDDGYLEAAESLRLKLNISTSSDVPSDYLYKAYCNSTKLLRTETLGCQKLPEWTRLCPKPVPPLEVGEEFITYSEDRRHAKHLAAVSPSALATTTHAELKQKSACRAVACSEDLFFFACGGDDNTVVVSVDGGRMQCTYNDHDAPITALSLHHQRPLCFSGSEDLTVKVFDVSKPSIPKAAGTINEMRAITSLCTHTCGDFLYVGTTDPVIRMYDLESLKCYVGLRTRDHHTVRSEFTVSVIMVFDWQASINDLCCSTDGSLLASSSNDGTIRVSD
eukprot:GHVQ01017090.1.p1 GENE.GHVQ01017090.1~~GHVQ01017090.1.p1  ORF type:complete len:318 (-),score=23.63 GHVQ01017090.1:2284-3237(-)